MIENTNIWRLKYRPTTLAEIQPYYRSIVPQISGYVDAKNFPHLLLIGPQGSGKTMIAEIIARELLQNELEMNYKLLFASDPISKQERDDAKRESHVSTKRIGSGGGANRTFRPFIQLRVRPFVTTQKFGNAPFKVLAVKDFHTLDVEQQAFRRIMEQYSANCRMILITDRISGIIDPVVSRCQVIMVPYLPQPLFVKCLKTIMDKEQIPVNLDVLHYAQYIAKNDIGKALDLLQLTYQHFKTIDVDGIAKVGDKMTNKAVQGLFHKTLAGNFPGIRKALRDIFYNSNLSKNEILIELNRYIMQIPLERVIRAQLIDLIAQTDFESLDSTDDEIQLEALLGKLAVIGGEF
jgi:DNA polymerase III delta prime subunit